ncbi:hypothetical protein [Bacillus phage 1]|jgi:hypothetical protein|uniref:Uncharacterized protein n=1 Tax=Bacillus phage 1 TaxID=2785079 RepID=A6XMJ7_9CAUD|nr:Arc-like repressor [Bacillus phage 1]ABJ09620.1 hypothetical protein [Bacillus phage 1]
MAKVLKDFKCKVTKRIYHAGDEYDGDRLEELQKLGYVAASKNPSEGDHTEWPKHVGGGVYELSNGDKVKGKEVALAAQAEIDASSN